MAIIKINGDLLKSNEQYIVHQCNCVTNNAANLAKAVFTKFPYANCYYNRKEKDIPGTIKIFGDGTDQRFVINLFGQYGPGPPKNNFDNKENRYTWFRKGLFEISKIPDLKSIAFPERIGCGVARGNWEEYLEILVKFEGYVNEKLGVGVYLYNNEIINESNQNELGFLKESAK